MLWLASHSHSRSATTFRFVKDRVHPGYRISAFPDATLAAPAQGGGPSTLTSLALRRPEVRLGGNTLDELGLRNVAFEVTDLQAAVDRVAKDGFGLVGGIGEYEGLWKMAYVRGPEGIIVSLAERIG